jgi:AcrR family transcriptional regulator
MRAGQAGLTCRSTRLRVSVAHRLLGCCIVACKSDRVFLAAKRLANKRKIRAVMHAGPGEKTTAERIAEIALRILEQEGPDAVSMRRLAKAAGITPMAIYHHYPSREALLKTITDDEFAKLKEYSDRLIAQSKGKGDLTRSTDAYLDYAFDRPRIFDYVFSKPRFDARTFPEDFRARRSPTLNPVADRVAEEMKEGVLRKDDIWEVALQLWAHTHGYVTLYRAGRFNMTEKQFRALYHRAVKRLLQGLLNPKH